eukprot:TRINITY_DN2293_c1_g2_i1.p1 TRINITY_DN2293_c1_g2~~TRINITY_DN2293_c1_g2_i1.p1  ORF type:complete len:728 (-),score=255.63 TRINITY_DN2293_c1_g2_i1:60-2198(-)
MDQLIPVINKLQDVFNAIGQESIDLPQIAVVGAQSSGKSSVLENIVGRDFLPRGSGIVTRRPLVLQLINVPKSENENDNKEWGEFLHTNEIFYDFNKIKEEIDNETERLTGKNKGISTIPINLKIYSPNVLNLTLVDLPGLTKVAVGEQPHDIEKQIREMVYTYVTKKNCIILAVTPANTDLATSDALQLAKEVDPEGRRTLGVLTKIDLMDKGTDCMDLLMGKIFQLKLGFIGVVNRGQQDIMNKKSIQQAHKSENEFFSTHPIYKTISGRLGTKFLAGSLNKVLMHHIRDCLPELKLKVNKMVTEAQLELMNYGDHSEGTSSQGAVLLQIITKFCNDYRDTIDGKFTDIDTFQELYGGARIKHIFNDVFGKNLMEMDPVDNLTPEAIRTAIRNASGTRDSLFIPEVSFENLVRQQVVRLKEPSLQCVSFVFDELQKIINNLECQELIRFVQLRDRVVEVANHLLVKCREPTKTMINSLVNIELSYINTAHPDFIGGGGALGKFFEKMENTRDTEEFQRGQEQQQQFQQNQQNQQIQQKNPPQTQPKQVGNSFFQKYFDNNKSNDINNNNNEDFNNMNMNNNNNNINNNNNNNYNRQSQQKPSNWKKPSNFSNKEQFETELIKDLLGSYFNIVRKNIMDTVPKTIMHFLVNESKRAIQHELVSELYKEDLFSELLKESDTISIRREACQKTLEVLRKANDVLNNVRDYNLK